MPVASVGCDNCTNAVCGDGYTNPVAGEICDDEGEMATCDADCTDVVAATILSTLRQGRPAMTATATTTMPVPTARAGRLIARAGMGLRAAV